MTTFVDMNEGNLPVDDEKQLLLETNDFGRSSRFAIRLSGIEPSGCCGGVCTTVQFALNAHLVLLGDYISPVPESIVNIGSSSRHSGKRNNEEAYDNDDSDESTTSLLNWFYYDEPETPIHPALEYETGRFLSYPAPRITMKFEDVQANMNDSPMQATSHTDPTRNIDQELHNGCEQIKVQNENSFRSFINNDSKLIVSLLFLTFIASFSVITAKFQSISMYNYPIFLMLMHSFLSVPFACIISLLYEIPPKNKASESERFNINILAMEREGYNDPTQDPNVHKIISNKYPGILSRLLVVGLLDAVASTLQTLATTYLPGSVIVLLPPMSSTALLYTLSLLRTKKYRKIHPLLPLFWSNKRKRAHSKHRKKLMVSSILFTIGLFFVLIGGIVYVFIPVVTSQNSPKYYCESIDDKFNERFLELAPDDIPIEDNACIMCRQARTKEHCLSQTRTNKHQNNNPTNMTRSVTKQVTGNVYGVTRLERSMQELINQSIQKEMADVTKWIQKSDDSEPLCRWIPFHESSKQNELTLIIWSTILVLSTIPMVLSSLLKQKIARVASSIISFRKSLCDNKNKNNMASDIAGFDREHHKHENLESIDTPSIDGSRTVCITTHLMDREAGFGTSSTNAHQFVGDMGSGQSRQPHLHPTLQFVLDNPRYWIVWMTSIQFVFCVLIALPAFNLILSTSSVESKSSSLLGPNYTSLWNITNEILVESDVIVTSGFLSTNSNMLLQNVWNGWLCYSAGVDTIATGCHPDTNMCSSSLAFWSVNLHVLSSVLYRICLFFVFKYMITTNLSQLQLQVRSLSSPRSTNVKSNCILPIGNERCANNLLLSVTNGSETAEEVHPNKSLWKYFYERHSQLKWNNRHRLIFLSLIATIPISDMLFLILPQILSQSKFLGIMPILEQNLPHYYSQSGGIPNAVSWEENMIGLFGIVSGLLIMHVYRFKQTSLFRQSASASKLPNESNLNWSDGSDFKQANSLALSSEISRDTRHEASRFIHSSVEDVGASALHETSQRNDYTTLLDSWQKNNKNEPYFATKTESQQKDNKSLHPILLRSQTVCDNYLVPIANVKPGKVPAKGHQRRHSQNGQCNILQESDHPTTPLLKLSGDV